MTARWRRAFRLSSGRQRAEEEVDEELAFHLAMRESKLRAAGLSDDEARARARERFGDVGGVRDTCLRINRAQDRRQRLARSLEDLVGDLKFAVRSLVRAPGFTLAAVLTLALGIGATTAILSVVNGVLLRPLPYPNHQRLALLWTTARLQGEPRDELPFSAANFLDLHGRLRAFEEVAAFRTWGYTLGTGTEPELVSGSRVSGGLFRVLGTRAILGRALGPEDDRHGAPRVAVIGWALWQRRFGGDRAVIGKAIPLNGEPYTLVGVMPRGFQFPRGAELPSGFQFARRAEIWTPIAFSPGERQARGTFNLAVVGLLRAGVSIAQARDDVATGMRGIAAEHGLDRIEMAGTVIPMQEQSVRQVRAGLLLLLGAVGFVLLIAWANVSNLLLARTAARQRELAVRAALGASAGRLVRQLVTENVLLATVGAGLGSLIALVGKDSLLALVPATMPRLDDVVIDARVIGATFAIALMAGATFGLLAALHVARGGLAGQLRTGGRSSAGAIRTRMRSLLIIGEVALSLVLLVGAALLAQSFVRMQRVSPGFVPDATMTAQLFIPTSTLGNVFAQDARYSLLFHQYLDRVRALPGVVDAGAISSLPLSGAWETTTLRIEGRPEQAAGERPEVEFQIASPGYFAAMKIPVRRGRAFGTEDRADSRPVALISEAAAARYWAGEDPIGRRITIFRPEPVEIVGVVGDVRQRSLIDPAEPTVYLPVAQFPLPFTTIVVRTSSDPVSIVPLLRRELQAVAPGVALAEVRTMSSVVEHSLGQRRFAMLLVGFFASSALLLAAVGLYGVIAYGVSQRTHEIGVRMALGARPRDVLRMVLGQGVALTAVGLAIGAAGSLALTSVVRRQLYDVSATDPVTYAAIALLLLAVAITASWVPARRATRVEATRALRDD